MSPGRIVGLDPGERRIGVAVADDLGLIAQPYSVLRRDAADFADALRAIAATTGTVLFVVGLPVSLSGREGAAAAAARELGRMVTDITGVAVEFYDERFTTTIAEQALLESGMRRRGRRERRDMVAAAVMLQGYLDRQARAD